MNSTMVMHTHYNFVMVAVSVLISVLSAYAALDLAERVTTTRGWARTAWLIAGASHGTRYLVNALAIR